MDAMRYLNCEKSNGHMTVGIITLPLCTIARPQLRYTHNSASARAQLQSRVFHAEKLAPKILVGTSITEITLRAIVSAPLPRRDTCSDQSYQNHSTQKRAPSNCIGANAETKS
jgi:hypothetical protein